VLSTCWLLLYSVLFDLFVNSYTGMLEAVRVRREGFAFRPFFSDFFNSYHSIAYRFTDPVSL